MDIKLSQIDIDVALTLKYLNKYFYVEHDTQNSVLTLSVPYTDAELTMEPVRQTAEPDILRTCSHHLIFTLRCRQITDILDAISVFPFVRTMALDSIQDTTGYHSNPVSWAQAQAKASLMIIGEENDANNMPGWFPIELAKKLDVLTVAHIEAVSDAIWHHYSQSEEYVEMESQPPSDSWDSI